MLHTVSSSYKELAKLVPGLDGRPSPSVRNKRRLREMARGGLPRPSQKTRVGRALSEYTSPANPSYDPDFHAEMKLLRPEWFMSQTEAASQKKQTLLDMARKGLARPSHDQTKLGQALSNYTRKSSPVYDPTFDRQIREIRPDWFVHRNQWNPQ